MAANLLVLQITQFPLNRSPGFQEIQLQKFFLMSFLFLFSTLALARDADHCGRRIAELTRLQRETELADLQTAWKAYNEDPKKDAGPLFKASSAQINNIAIKIFRRIPQGKVDVETLIVEGGTGFAAALRDYNVESGSFKSYLSLRVNGTIIDYLRSLSNVSRKILKYQKKLNEAEASFFHANGRNGSQAEIRELLRQGLDANTKNPELTLDEILASKRNSATNSSLDGMFDRPGKDEASPISIIDETVSSFSGEFERATFWEHIRIFLPSHFQPLVIMKFRDGKSHKEIAKFYGVTESAISLWLSNVLDKLRGYFQRYPEEARILFDIP